LSFAAAKEQGLNSNCERKVEAQSNNDSIIPTLCDRGTQVKDEVDDA
jgi:hypothetical protein